MAGGAPVLEGRGDRAQKLPRRPGKVVVLRICQWDGGEAVSLRALFAGGNGRQRAYFVLEGGSAPFIGMLGFVVKLATSGGG